MIDSADKKRERDALRLLADRIDAHVREQGGGARLAGGRYTGRIVVTYGLKQGAFQSVSLSEAEAYVTMARRRERRRAVGDGDPVTDHDEEAA